MNAVRKPPDETADPLERALGDAVSDIKYAGVFRPPTWWVEPPTPPGVPHRVAKVRQYALDRKARVKQATPKWADLNAIEALRAKAKRMTEKTGVKHVVDHIIPISSPTVCGLHVHWNMQVVTESQNRRKHTAYRSDGEPVRPAKLRSMSQSRRSDPTG